MKIRILGTLLAAALCWVGQARAQGSGSQNDPSFNLVNRSGVAINEIYVSPSADNNWGQDRLGQNMLPGGRSFAVRLRGDCVNDIRVVYANGSAEEKRRVNTCQLNDVAFGVGPENPSPGGNQGSSQGGGSSQQQSGGRRDNGNQGGNQGGQRGGNVPQGNPSFNLVNHSGRAINEVYASPSSDDRWGQDRLGQNVLPDGQSYAVRLPVGGCLYDIRVVYADNSNAEKRRVNTCDVSDVQFP